MFQFDALLEALSQTHDVEHNRRTISSSTSTQQQDSLPSAVLGWLLSDPSYLLPTPRPPPNIKWERKALRWQRAPTTVAPATAVSVLEKEHQHAFAQLPRRLSFNRRAWFRVHQFTTAMETPQHQHWAQESVIACNDTTKAHTKTGVSVSEQFQQYVQQCVVQAERNDESFRGSVPGRLENAAPVGQHSGGQNTAVAAAGFHVESWFSIQPPATPILLQHHQEAHVSTLWCGIFFGGYYASQVDNNTPAQPAATESKHATHHQSDARLLFRLSSGCCSGAFSEPTEQYDVPRMAVTGVMDADDGQIDHCCYAEVKIVPGTLLLFPPWLSHAISPHFAPQGMWSVGFVVTAAEDDETQGVAAGSGMGGGSDKVDNDDDADDDDAEEKKVHGAEWNLILDVDGTLVQDVDSHEDLAAARPHLAAFLTFVFAEFRHVAIWSAAGEHWISRLVKHVIGPCVPQGHSFYFVWTGDRVTRRHYTKGLGDYGVQAVKKLKKVYRAFPDFNQDNTLILDDTPSTYKQNYGNAIGINTWYGHTDDRELLDVMQRLREWKTEFQQTGTVRNIHKYARPSFTIRGGFEL